MEIKREKQISFYLLLEGRKVLLYLLSGGTSFTRFAATFLKHLLPYITPYFFATVMSDSILGLRNLVG